MWACIALLTLASERAHVGAEDVDESRRVQWSLPAAIRRASQSAPSVRAARAQLEASRGYRAFEAVPVVGNPFLSVRALLGVPDQSAATYSVLLGIPFDVSGRQAAWSDEASQTLVEMEARIDVATNEARTEAERAFMDLAISEEALRLSEERVRLAEQLTSYVQARVSAQAGTALDLSLAQAELGAARADSADRRRRLVEAQANLRAALDLDPDVEPTVDAPGGVAPEAPALREVLELARERRAEPRVHRAAAIRHRLSERRIFAESIDLLMVGVDWEAQANVQTKQSWGLSASMALPFIRTGQGERALAQGQSQMENEMEVIASRAIERDAVAAWSALDASLEQLRILEAEALQPSERAAALIDQLLAAGEVDVFRVLAVRRDVFAQRARRIDALRDVWTARVALDRATGGALE